MMTSRRLRHSEVAGLHRSHRRTTSSSAHRRGRALPDEQQAMMDTRPSSSAAGRRLRSLRPERARQHGDMDKSDVYKSGGVQFNEGGYLQCLCNFRVRRWELPVRGLDCEPHAYLDRPRRWAVGAHARGAGAWDASDDTSAVSTPARSSRCSSPSGRARPPPTATLSAAVASYLGAQQSAAGSGTQAWTTGSLSAGECAAERCVPTRRSPATS